MRPNAQALLERAQSLQQQGRLSEAISAWKQLLALRADLPDAWFNLAVLLRKTGQLSPALACYEHALHRGVARPEEAHLNRAVIYSDCLHQNEAAERELTRALTLNPTFVPALMNLANLYEDQGRAESARLMYEKVMALEPRHADALARYAGIRNFTSADCAADPLIGRMQQLFINPSTSAADRATLGFALGRALDSCGAYAEAFQTYAEANRYSRVSAPPGTGHYDRVAEKRFVDRLIAAFPAREGPEHAATDTSRPIFICGMFRSGSTLIEQLICRHSDIIAGGELECLPNLVQTALQPFPESLAQRSAGELESLAASYLRELRLRFPNARRITDKRPDNFLYIGLIKRLFPQARIVHTRRNPLDNCLSIFFLHLDQRLAYALDLQDIGHHYLQYHRLMQHWKALYGADIHDVDYDEYVHNPAEEARRLFEFLEVEPRALSESMGARESGKAPAAAGYTPPGINVPGIKTASVWQVREPLYQRSSGRAVHYSRELAGLRQCLEAAGCPAAITSCSSSPRENRRSE